MFINTKFQKVRKFKSPNRRTGRLAPMVCGADKYSVRSPVRFIFLYSSVFVEKNPYFVGCLAIPCFIYLLSFVCLFFLSLVTSFLVTFSFNDID